jgi:putative multicomponent Na+:H+ antiporter subunit B
MIDKYIYIIVALLPLSAFMLVTQKNPYHALVMRGILGAVAALIYAILGAGDVALTEAMVGTMLAVTLNVIAVRSSLIMRLGILTEDTENNNYLEELIAGIKKVINKYHLRLELVEYSNSIALQQGLETKKVHAICTKQKETETKPSYNTAIRVKRLFEIMQTELIPETTLIYVTVADQEEKH